ncbi:septum formation initiator family protein [Candidatus Dojkabacteria bacterium]|nr:septum formation initiator family protein [Candidatus Dojkabacteria bacterium]
MNRLEEKKKNKSSSRVFSFLLAAVFTGLSAVLVVNSVKSLRAAYNRMELLDQASGEVDELRVRNLELVSRKEEIIGDDYVEKEARDRLYYAKDGEIVAVLPDTADVQGVVSEDEDTVEDKDGEWKSWWQFLIKGV